MAASFDLFSSNKTVCPDGLCAHHVNFLWKKVFQANPEDESKNGVLIWQAHFFYLNWPDVIQAGADKFIQILDELLWGIAETILRNYFSDGAILKFAIIPQVLEENFESVRLNIPVMLRWL